MPYYRSTLAVVFLTGSLAACLAWTARLSPAADSKAATIHLFNGQDLSNFYTWLVDHKYKDPDEVFTVVDQIDGAPAIRVSGQHYGGLITRQEYSNYHLVAEFRWGPVTWAPRKNRTKDSGILLHCQDPEGNSRNDFNGPWMRSIEFQIIEGGVGDFILVGGFDKQGARHIAKLSAKVRAVKTGNRTQYHFDPKGREQEFQGGRINWFGRDPNWQDVLGFRGKHDVESPDGQWTRLEVICDGDKITNIVNGTVVNSGAQASLTRGKILFQSEGAELYFRKIELTPLDR